MLTVIRRLGNEESASRLLVLGEGLRYRVECPRGEGRDVSMRCDEGGIGASGSGWRRPSTGSVVQKAFAQSLSHFRLIATRPSRRNTSRGPARRPEGAMTATACCAEALSMTAAIGMRGS